MGVIVGLVFYFKPSETKKKPIEKRPSSTKIIHEGNLKDVQLFGEKNQFVLSKDLTLVDGKYLVGFDYVKTDDRIKWEYVGFRYYEIDNHFKETTVNALDEIRKTAPKAFIYDYQINVNILILVAQWNVVLEMGKIFITSWMNRNTIANMPSQRAVQLRKK